MLQPKCHSSAEQNQPTSCCPTRPPQAPPQRSLPAPRAAGPPPLPGILPRAQVPPPGEAVPFSRRSGTRRRFAAMSVMAAVGDVFRRARGRTLTAFRQGARNSSGGLRVPAGSILCRAAGREGWAWPRRGAECSEVVSGGRSPSGRGTFGTRRGLLVEPCDGQVSVLCGRRGPY